MVALHGLTLVPVTAPCNPDSSRPPRHPTRTYRSTEPLRVLGEVSDWPRLTPEALQAWRDRLAAILDDERGEIIN